MQSVNGLRYIIPYEKTTVHWPRDIHAGKPIVVALAEMFGGPRSGVNNVRPDADEVEFRSADDVDKRVDDESEPINTTADGHGVQLYWAGEIAAGRVLLKVKKVARDAPEPQFTAIHPDLALPLQCQIKICRHVHERVTVAADPVTLYEDSYIVAVDKPGGVPVQDDCDGFAAVCQLMRHLRPELTNLRPAHRIDIGTSGVLILAKGSGNARRMRDRFAERQPPAVAKTYVARVQGCLPITADCGAQDPDSGGWLVVEQHQQFVSLDGRAYVVRSDAKGAKEARTDLRRIRDFHDGTTLIECRLHTGRRHQIRCCLASLGCPIANDSTYGRKPSSVTSNGGRPMRMYADDEHGTLCEMYKAAAVPWCDKCKWCLAAVRGDAVAPPASGCLPLWLHALVCEFCPDGPRIEAPLPPWATESGEAVTEGLSRATRDDPSAAPVPEAPPVDLTIHPSPVVTTSSNMGRTPPNRFSGTGASFHSARGGNL